jgi:hypothetical protein
MQAPKGGAGSSNPATETGLQRALARRIRRSLDRNGADAFPQALPQDIRLALPKIDRPQQDPGTAGRALDGSRDQGDRDADASKYFSASNAAMQPLPAEVMA